MNELIEGEWKDDKRHGNGHMEYANGDKYTGEWVADERTQNGVYVRASYCRVQ